MVSGTAEEKTKMKATTKIQAERIAKAGAAKITAETHEIKPSPFKRLIGEQFTYINRASGARYTTSITPSRTFCACPFFRENREFGICKHIHHAREEAEYAASVEAREAEYAPNDRLA